MITLPFSETSAEEKEFDSLFSKFDAVLKASKETTERLRANSHLDFSPQFANCMTRYEADCITSDISRDITRGYTTAESDVCVIVDLPDC